MDDAVLYCFKPVLCYIKLSGHRYLSELARSDLQKFVST